MVVKTLVINESLLKGELAGKQYQVAEMLGVHPSTLYRKIRRTHKLTLYELNQIAVILGRDTHDFLSVVEVEADSNGQEYQPDYDLEAVTDNLKKSFIDTHKGQASFECEMKEGYLANYDFIKKSSEEWDFTLGDGL